MKRRTKIDRTRTRRNIKMNNDAVNMGNAIRIGLESMPFLFENEPQIERIECPICEYTFKADLSEDVYCPNCKHEIIVL